QYIDTDSFARRFFIEETALNSDAFITSCYFYKKRNDNRIYAGPLWDFDSVLGESDSVDHEEMGNVWLNYDETTVLSMDENRATTAVLPWDEQLYELPEYRNILERTYRKLLPQFEALLNEQIDIYADQVRQSVALDSIRWDYAETEAGHYSSFDNNIRYMKFFLAKRINFLNRQFGLEEYPYENTSGAAHNITCVIGGQEIIIPVEDGSFLNPDMLPPYDKENHTGWIYEWDHTPLSEYLPVYEDLTLYLE
ncbi:MAG: CotH kinase family protein, partial [Lachnospiraceae bacterium]|nr:CotH kinase family protein [Lachnospiraceae bacterium]